MPALCRQLRNRRQLKLVGVAAAAITFTAMSVCFSKAVAAVAVPALPQLSDRIFLVTGSTDGIGKFTAEQLALQGATLSFQVCSSRHAPSTDYVQHLCCIHHSFCQPFVVTLTFARVVALEAAPYLCTVAQLRRSTAPCKSSRGWRHRPGAESGESRGACPE